MSTSSALALNTFQTSGGAQIFQIALQAFPGLSGYVYLVMVDDDKPRGNGPYRVLIDTGSGFGESNQELEAGLGAAGAIFGWTGEHSFGFQDLTHILITHGHIDHFGGLAYIRPQTDARLGVHELDLRILTNYEERLVMVSRRLDSFLIEAGVSEGSRSGLIEMYRLTKSLYHSVRVDFTYEAAGMRLGPFEFFHVPGHCAGHVVIRLHDVLFSGDHVLEETSPHQSPEHLTLSTGLEHYLRSLEALKTWARDIRLTLGGHKAPINDLPGRIDAIRKLHEDRLQKVLDLLDEPHTIAEVSRALFGETHGYNILLALEEAGAHVEYLYQRGLLGIENLPELESAAGPLPIRYRCLPCRQEVYGG
jgi:glyoxylase-like metal-dependent hydrolase (beta-lactamase superfamily II)